MAKGIGSFFDIDESDVRQTFEFQRERDRFKENMEFLNSMSVEEHTLYKKWQELNVDRVKMFKKKSTIGRYYDWLWRPADIRDKDRTIAEVEAIDPVVSKATGRGVDKWIDVRSLIHTMSLAQNPGRLVRFFVTDKMTDKLLGVIALSSDVSSLKVRDDYIGWTKDNKFVDGRLNNLAIASTICATQPLGFNFLGGKLVAALTTSSPIRDTWYEDYGDPLVGITTTSLYGQFSQYSGMIHFKSMGLSAGKILMKPDDEFYDIWVEYIKETDPETYKNAMETESGQVKTGAKNNVITAILKKLGLKVGDYEHGYQRGVYYASLYENSNEFLRNEVTFDQLVLKDKYFHDIKGAVDWWRPKAIRRYEKLHEQGRLNDSSLFYLPMIGMSWEEARETYLKDVGR